IENKKSDAVSCQAKQAQWNKIALEFNSQNTTNRCSKVLKKKWENMKKTVKDKVAGHRKHAMGTGGGPPLPDLKMEPWEEEILMHIKLTAVGLPPVFDDDNQDEIQVIEVGGFDPLIEAVAVEPSDTDTDTLKDLQCKEVTLKERESSNNKKDDDDENITADSSDSDSDNESEREESDSSQSENE
ncbi:uncharacterized protein LOC123701178, partial [Colias croceus]|uniref:uncharacterized protein LOC123701178 n=1 Tax=Colias crocea TaxID=72248 RepID=UPI001E27EC49